jgi:hypothetical protein
MQPLSPHATAYSNISRHNPQLSVAQASTDKQTISQQIRSIPQPQQTEILCKLIAIKYHRQGLWNSDESIAKQNQLWNEISALLPEGMPVDNLMFFIKNDGYTGYIFQRKIPTEFQDLLLLQLDDFERQNIINTFEDVDREAMCNFLADATGKDWGTTDDKSGLTRNPSTYYPTAHFSRQLLNKEDFFSSENLNLRNRPKNIVNETLYLTKHADAGHPVAQNLLGEVYGNVYGTNPQNWPKDEAKAVKYFIQSADKGNTKAKYNVLCMFSENRGLKNADEATRSRAVQILKDGAREYGNSMLGRDCRRVLGEELLKETGHAEAIKFLDELMEFDPNLTTLSQIADILCHSEDARKSLGESKVSEYLKQAADELEHSQAALAYADICSKSEHSFFRDGFGTPQKTAEHYYQIGGKSGNKQTEV